MAWQEVSPMMNFQRKRNGDASIRRRWYLKRNIRRKSHLDKVEKYAVLATIDKKELTIPFLNIKVPAQEAIFEGSLECHLAGARNDRRSLRTHFMAQRYKL